MKKLYITFLALVLILTIIVPVGVANADSTIEVEGEVMFTAADDGIILNKHLMKGWVSHDVSYVNGDIIGEASEILDARVNLKSLKVNSQGTQIFEGTVCGISGTVRLLLCY
ncbi:MAG TPA: hypothetical protein G4O15_12490 [Dehalococcoidia bacterium]|nr:hypothetical protein [Dehalococcoidia bacterium]